MDRISDEELKQALAQNVDFEGNDAGLAASVTSWTVEERSRSEDSLRTWVTQTRQSLRAPNAK